MAGIARNRDAFASSAAPSAGLSVLARDRFRELAERQGVNLSALKPDAFAPKRGRGAAAAQKAPVPRAAAFKPAPLAVAPSRILSNGAALKVVDSKPVTAAVEPVEAAGTVELGREKRTAKSSTLVLVSGASAAAAVAEPAVHAGGGDGPLVMPALSTPKSKSRSGGGGNGKGGDGAGQPSRDGIFTQDDLMAVLIVLAVLLLLALYFFRGGGSAPADDRILNTQSAATEPVVEPVVPPADPFGDRAVDLTPRSPPPVESAAPAAATPPPKPVEIGFQTYFCTASSQLTPAAKVALEKQVADWGSDVAGADLIVAGYADTRGAADYNLALSKARANSVADFLRSKNFTVVESVAVGELQGLADNENCANQRRVDIRLASGAVEPPSRSCAPPQEVADLTCG